MKKTKLNYIVQIRDFLSAVSCLRSYFSYSQLVSCNYLFYFPSLRYILTGFEINSQVRILSEPASLRKNFLAALPQLRCDSCLSAVGGY